MSSIVKDAEQVLKYMEEALRDASNGASVEGDGARVGRSPEKKKKKKKPGEKDPNAEFEKMQRKMQKKLGR